MSQRRELEGSRANEAFDAEWYVREYPDVARSKLDPVEHYESLGKLLGRAPSHQAMSVLDVRYVIAKESRFSARDEVALMVAHAPSGRLKPHVLPYMKQLRDAGLSVVLVAVVDCPLELLDEEIATADSVIVRDNVGYDFGAWAHGFELCPTLSKVRLLIMTNDSVVPTADKAVFQAMIDRVRGCDADISGLTANHEHGWHIQSYFLAFTRKALASSAFGEFIRGIRRLDDKDELVRAYEVPFAARMQAAGLTVKALYHGPYPTNPVIWSWRELVENGFPFIKLLLLRKVMSTYTDDQNMLDDLHENWPTVLATAGFDIRLIRHAIRAADMSWMPKGSSKCLLQNPKNSNKLPRPDL
jgi:hypothetical protein